MTSTPKTRTATIVYTSYTTANAIDPNLHRRDLAIRATSSAQKSSIKSASTSTIKATSTSGILKIVASTNAVPNPKFTAMPVALTAYPAASISAACLRLVNPTVTVYSTPIRTVQQKMTSTLWATATVTALIDLPSSYTSYFTSTGYSTSVIPQTSLTTLSGSTSTSLYVQSNISTVISSA